MKNEIAKATLNLLIAAGVAVMVFAGGCDEEFRERYSRVMNYSHDTGSAVAGAPARVRAVTHNGRISTTGTEGSGMIVLEAEIVGRGRTPEEARAVAEKIGLKIEEFPDGVHISVDNPENIPTKFFGVNLRLNVPAEVNLNAVTHNGGVNIASLRGEIHSVTHNGSVECSAVSGHTRLETHNGSITARGLEGECTLVTHNGKVRCEDHRAHGRVVTHNGSIMLDCSGMAGPVRTDVETHNGCVEFVCPAELSARVVLSTSNGGIHCDRGGLELVKIDKRHIEAVAGDGTGEIRLQTHNGSIRLR